MIELVGGIAGRAISQVVDQAVSGGEAASAGQAGRSSFSDVLQSLGTGMVDNLRAAETQSFKAVSGDANTREVVDALMSAEQSLQTALAIRDKLVTAYLEVSRMQI
jgi:flagellar hook-basal body complex protein FliE